MIIFKKKYLGFTFIEILISLTIFSIVSISLYSTFFSGTSSWKRSENLNRLYQEARWSLDTIAGELHNAIIFSYKDRRAGFAVFEGTDDSISFLVEDEYGIKRVSYFLEAKEEEGDNLIFSLKRQESSLIDSLQISEERKLTETFSSLVAEGGLRFSYPYNKGDSENEDIEWKDNWQKIDEIPEGVKIELVLQNPSNPNVKIAFNKTVFIPVGIIAGEKQ